MTSKIRRYSILGLISFLSAVCLWFIAATPSLAHWADLSTAEIIVEPTTTQIALTYPTKLTAFADDDASGQLSNEEIVRHNDRLQTYFQDHIRLKSVLAIGQSSLAALTVGPRAGPTSASAQAAPDTHSSLQLIYRWPDAVQGIDIDYNLFIADAPEASCLATISQAGQFTSHVFTPQDTTLTLAPAGGLLSNGKWILTLIGVFAWGAVHSMSPGHGKTLVAAYLVGERATPRHAIFLAMTTTITHTLGVFALGLITLFAARYILPEQLYPWLSLLSGSMVIAIGVSLLWQRWRGYVASKRGHHKHHSHKHHGHDHHGHDHHGHTHHGHTHHDHHHSHDHQGSHSHGGHEHTHLPATNGEPITWRSLLFLGLSAGLVPCPAALVLLLGAIALGNPLSGLILVLVFSLGLSVVLTALGLLLVYAKQMFAHLPVTQAAWTRWLPVASAFGIVVIGIGISTQSLLSAF